MLRPHCASEKDISESEAEDKEEDDDESQQLTSTAGINWDAYSITQGRSLPHIIVRLRT